MSRRRLTETVGVIEQRLPPKRRRLPSLPHVGMEGIAKQRVHVEPKTTDGDGRRKLTAEEQERWLGSGEPVGFLTDGHRITMDENLDVGAGATKEGKRPRILSTAEAMHRVGTIGGDEWQAVNILRLKLLRQLHPSEGVSNYGQHPGGSDPAAKGDRRGRTLTGFKIDGRSGRVHAVESAMAVARRNRTELRETAELLFAAVGLETTEGKRVFDHEKAVLLVRCVLPTANPPKLDEIGRQVTLYDGPKQRTAAAATVIREMLGRMAVHLGLKKGVPWDEGISWAVAQAEAGIK